MAQNRGRQVTGRRFALMLEHVHALEAWCCPLVLGSGEQTLLLHVDAHDDLSAPVSPTADSRTFRAPIGPDVMTLDDPKTVRSFAMRGYIGIGGFIAPMLAGTINSILHVAGMSDEARGGGASLVGGVGMDDGCICVDKCEMIRPGIPYRRVTLPEALDAADHFDGGVLLDIDLDAFCNRFDTHGGDVIPDGEAIRALAEAAQLLTASGLPKRATVTTVASSPAFSGDFMAECARIR